MEVSCGVRGKGRKPSAADGGNAANCQEDLVDEVTQGLGFVQWRAAGLSLEDKASPAFAQVFDAEARKRARSGIGAQRPQRRRISRRAGAHQFAGGDRGKFVQHLNANHAALGHDLFRPVSFGGIFGQQVKQHICVEEHLSAHIFPSDQT